MTTVTTPQVYQHKFTPQLTCEIIETTAKGYKVRQLDTRKKKPKYKIQYYYFADFTADKGLWKKI